MLVRVRIFGIYGKNADTGLYGDRNCKKETVQNMAEKALEDKVFAVIRENVKVVETEISVEDFNKLFE